MWEYSRNYEIWECPISHNLESIFIDYVGYCTEQNCNCSGSMTYEVNENLIEERNNLIDNGYIFLRLESSIED